METESRYSIVQETVLFIEWYTAFVGSHFAESDKFPLPPLSDVSALQIQGIRTKNENCSCLGLQIEQSVIAVSNGHFGDVGDVADLALGYLLVAEQRGGVDRGGGKADG